MGCFVHLWIFSSRESWILNTCQWKFLTPGSRYFRGRAARSSLSSEPRAAVPKVPNTVPCETLWPCLCRMIGYAVCIQWVEDWQLSKVILENLWLYTTWYKSIAISMIKILHWLTWLLSHCSVKSSALARQTLFIKLIVHGVSWKIYIKVMFIHDQNESKA